MPAVGRRGAITHRELVVGRIQGHHRVSKAESSAVAARQIESGRHQSGLVARGSILEGHHIGARTLHHRPSGGTRCLNRPTFHLSRLEVFDVRLSRGDRNGALCNRSSSAKEDGHSCGK